MFCLQTEMNAALEVLLLLYTGLLYFTLGFESETEEEDDSGQ